MNPANIEAGRVFVLEQGSEVVGFYNLEPIDEDVVELLDLFIEPVHIGTGCGNQLWDHAVATASSMGFTRMHIESDPNAEPFYLARGAARTGDVESTVSTGRKLPTLLHDLQ